MAIREITVDVSGGKGIRFPLSALALKYCKGKGLEIGASSHNSFGLEGSRNVSPGDKDTIVFRDSEVELCGTYADIDIYAEGDAIPVPDQSEDYVINSHVFEHLPNPARALREWWRIVKDKGIIFIIAPKHGAHAPDKARPLSTLAEIIKADEEDWTVDTVPSDVMEAAGGRRGHTFTWTYELAIELVDYVNQKYGTVMSVITWLPSDDKVKNGWCIVLRVYHPNDKNVEPFTFTNDNQDVLKVNSVKQYARNRIK